MRIARNTIRSRDRPLGCTTLVLDAFSQLVIGSLAHRSHDEQKAASN